MHLEVIGVTVSDRRILGRVIKMLRLHKNCDCSTTSDILTCDIIILFSNLMIHIFVHTLFCIPKSIAESFSHPSTTMPRKNEEISCRRETGRPAVSRPRNEVVISGIAGRFPESDNLMQLQMNLLNKVDLVTNDDRRWKSDDPEIPQRRGKINNVEKFDALFFGVHHKQAHMLDPMCRMLLEHAYEAIIDAGVNPRRLRGTNTGVFIGASVSESEKTLFYTKQKANGYGLTGCCRAMLANRISYWLGTTGPSYSVDAACSSSLFAVDHAYKAISRGDCDAAIVGGVNLSLHPFLSLQFARLGVLSPDGCCKSFDADANGYCRSDAISVIFLQKAEHAKRIYAHVVHTKINCDGFKDQGISFPSADMQADLLQKCYEECGVAPSSVAYIEAHGTGTKVGDPVEIKAIEKIFCPNRGTPLRIGSVKTNLGHAEAAAGLCGITKVVISMESGVIPPNLHYNRPLEGVEALEHGRIQVLTEPTPWEGGYVGVSSFGFGGANAHVLLKSNSKEKINGGVPCDDIPRLVVASGRTEEAVTTLLDDLCSRPVDVEFVSLFHNIYAENIPSHLYRGYAILPAKGLPENNIQAVQQYSGAKRPVWFVFSGMGSQWTGMGEDLLRIPIFAKAILKCDTALKSYGVDIMNILTSKNPNVFDNILNSFVGIAAIQIGLVDLLASIGIVPDNIIGHSVGELGCAYADGCFTAEQTILAAYFRGLISIETETICGSMAAVGLGHKELRPLCPPDIEIACHNSLHSSTISGPTKSMKAFIAQLQARDVFVREVSAGNIAFHSRYITAMGPKLLASMKKFVPDPKLCSRKWLSTSVPQNEWGTRSAQLCSAEYHTNNLLSPVLFEETSNLIPNNAITIEIAPHGLLQAILRRSLDECVVNISLMKRGYRNNVEHLLRAIGNMYAVGLQPQVNCLYPEVEYPVSRGTPMISPLIRWEHSENWFVSSYSEHEEIFSGVRVVQVDVTDSNFEWMGGNIIDGENLMSVFQYLELVWEMVGLMLGTPYMKTSILFEDVQFRRTTLIPKDGVIKLTITIQKVSGRFEVIEGNAAVVTGVVKADSNSAQETINSKVSTEDNENEHVMTMRDIYKELHLRGYRYTEAFCGIKAATLRNKEGLIAWKSNWTTFMDNILQFRILEIDTRELLVPTRIQKLLINPGKHLNHLRSMSDENKEFTVQIYEDIDIIVSGGVEITGLATIPMARKDSALHPILQRCEFVAHQDRVTITLEAVTYIAIQIAAENHLGINIKTIELIDGAGDITSGNLISSLIWEVLSNSPLLRADISIIASDDKLAMDALPSYIRISTLERSRSESNALLAVSHGLLASQNSETLKQLYATTGHTGFVLAIEPLGRDDDIALTIERDGFDILLEKQTDMKLIFLLRKRVDIPAIAKIIQINNHEFGWLTTLQLALKAEGTKTSGTSGRILLVSQNNFESGLMGLVNCLRREPGGENIQALLIQDSLAPEFSLGNSLYSDQLALGLALNVLRPQNVWGTYRFFPLNPLLPRPVCHIQLSQKKHGDISTLEWVEGNIQSSPNHGDIVRVHYSALNYRDLMISTGKSANRTIPRLKKSVGRIPIGFEYSGIDVNGRAVMGILEGGTLTNLCQCDRDLCWSVPDNWSLEEAATVPLAYATVYYALVIHGRIETENTILIHAGSSCIGQAAITLALHEGCEVFTTVGTREERQFIRNRFAQIDDNHICDLRDTSFEQSIIYKTRGRKVDIVLNCLAQEQLRASVRCLTRRGKFLEIGRSDLTENNLLGMEALEKEISFTIVSLHGLFHDSSGRKLELAELFKKGIKDGVVQPFTRTVFPKNEVDVAFKYMAAGKYMGKLVVNIQEQNEHSHIPSLLGLPRYYCLQDSSYLLLGGLGGFGLELADWLVLRGARKLVFTSRNGISNGYQRTRINIWEGYGVKIVSVAGKDASTRQGCEDILKEAIALGPVDAIFNLAVVTKDGLCENQTVEAFGECFKAKAWATEQMDMLSRVFCPHLRHFVVFSSLTSGRGLAGQTNYGMANSIMERICEKRAAENLPGLAIQWGAIGDVGFLAEMHQDYREVVIAGTLQQSISSCLHVLDVLLLQGSSCVASMVLAEKTVEIIKDANIVDAVMYVMGIKDFKTISLYTPFAELGMDSLMIVEIMKTLQHQFGVFLTTRDIHNLTFVNLQEISLRHVKCKNISIIASDDKLAMDALPSYIRISTLERSHSESNALLAVSHGLLASQNSETLKQLYATTGHTGFVIAIEPLGRDDDIALTIERDGFDILLEKQTDMKLIFLLRKRVDIPAIAKIIQINNHEFGWLTTLQLALKAEGTKTSGTSGRILLVSQNNFESGLMGLVNCLRREPGGENIQALLIQDSLAPEFSLGNSLYSDQLALGLALNVLRPQNVWGTYRFFPLNPLLPRPVCHIQLSQKKHGDISTLEWVEGNIQSSPNHGDIVRVHYSALNYRDLMISTGKSANRTIPRLKKSVGRIPIGFEYSGIDVNGRAVMGILEGGTLTNLCQCDRDLCWSVPDNWSLEEAATVPLAYATVYYALVIHGRIETENTILIHAGSSCIGQAAITLALHEGCEVFTTVGTREERQFIRNRFAQIDDNHICDLRDTSFEQSIIYKTRGRKVDIVLNCLAQEQLRASVRCLTRRGKFLEIGRSDLTENNLLGMEALEKEISFTIVSLHGLFHDSSGRKLELAELFKKGIKDGVVQPFTRTVFPKNEVDVAFKYMAAGKYMGKLVVNIQEQNEHSHIPSLLGLPRYYCLQDSSYLLLGGLGGFGLELADWLVLCGARKLVFTSRNGISNRYQRTRMNIWEGYGVKIVSVAGKDASTRQGCGNILKEAIALGPVDAIFNLAVVTKDGLCENQTVEAFGECFKAKAWATEQMDMLSRVFCPRLRHFVVFSSLTSGRGLAGQTNYGMANSIMERICEKRAAENLPGLAIQWGAIGDVGFLAEMHQDYREVVIAGTLQQSISSCLHVLDVLLLQGSSCVASMVLAEKTVEIIKDANIVDAVMYVMGIKDFKTISLYTPFAELGMDSLMIVEIMKTLQHQFGVFLTARDIHNLTFVNLQAISLRHVKCKSKV